MMSDACSDPFDGRPAILIEDGACGPSLPPPACDIRRFLMAVMSLCIASCFARIAASSFLIASMSDAAGVWPRAPSARLRSRRQKATTRDERSSGTTDSFVSGADGGPM